jgi:hypothetical protein
MLCVKPVFGAALLGCGVLVGHGAANAAEAGAVTGGNKNSGSWNALAGPVQWVEVDLGAPRRVRFVVLTPEQSPDGVTQHRITGGKTASLEKVLAATIRRPSRAGRLRS